MLLIVFEIQSGRVWQGKIDSKKEKVIILNLELTIRWVKTCTMKRTNQ